MSNITTTQDTKATLALEESDFDNEVDQILASYNGDEGELIPILQRVQQAFSYVPERAITKIARFLHIPEVTVFGVATFYAQFKLVPTGRNIIRICRGTACHVRGGARILSEVESRLGIKPGETTPDLEYSLETVACIGACALSPAMVINDKVYGRLTPQKVKQILSDRSS